MKKYLAEFIGTFLLVFVGCGTAVASNALFSAQGFLPASFGSVIVALAFGLALAILTYMLGKASGGHLNPAVSVAMVVRKRLSAKDLIGYVAGQFAGGIAGAALLIVLLGGRTSLGANGYDALSTFGINMWVALLVELIATFFFVFAVLSAKEREGESGAGAMIIGFAFTAVYMFSVPFTGGGANPARSLGPALLQGADALTQVWVFIVAPIAGAILAALLYTVFYGGVKADAEEIESDAEKVESVEENAEEKEI